MNIIHRFLYAGLLFCLVALTASGLAGCDGAGPIASEEVPAALRFRVVSGTAKHAGRIVVEEVRLLVKTVKFNAEDGQEYVFKTESFVANLDLSGRATTIAVGAVPPGAYKRVTFKIHKPEDDEAVPDPAFKEGPSGDQRFSVIIKGRIDGAPFVLKVRESIQQRLAFSPPFVVEAGAASVTVTLLADVDSWFVGEDNRTLDPRVEDDADEIADALKASFRALGE